MWRHLPTIFATAHLLIAGVALATWLQVVGGTQQVWRSEFLPKVMRVAEVVDFPSAQLAGALLEKMGLSGDRAVASAFQGVQPREFFLITYWTPLVLLGTVQWSLIGLLLHRLIPAFSGDTAVELSHAASR